MATDRILLSDLLQCLVECSEKAARIAQIFREEDDLFQLLVQEKSQIEIYKCYFRDFKTLADVLVQETIKKDVGEKFPSLTSHIQGEEQNIFQNVLGESIKVELTSSVSHTLDLLDKVLDGRSHVAKALALAVHSTVDACEMQFQSSSVLEPGSVGVWIDPIDSTAEYIKAKEDESEDHGIQQCGLQCVCVLIGVYDLNTGDPIIGVVNQPFFERDTDSKRWRSRFYWGVDYQTSKATSSTLNLESEPDENIIVLSNSESQDIHDMVRTSYVPVHTAGAGHKSLLVARKKANLYILSPSSTFFWDVCGPHAILAAQGGGVVKFRDLVSKAELKETDLKAMQIKYRSSGTDVDSEAFRNTGGILAYRNPTHVVDLWKLMSENRYRLEGLVP